MYPLEAYPALGKWSPEGHCLAGGTWEESPESSQENSWTQVQHSNENQAIKLKKLRRSSKIQIMATEN